MIEKNRSIIQFQNVYKNFGTFKALQDVSLNIGRGQRVVVCGPSGSGKSTLIRCINRLEQHDEGKIILDGVEIDDSASARKQISANVGMVFQNFNLFPHIKVIDNLTIGPVRSLGLSHAEAKEKAMHYLEKVKIVEQANKYPRHLSGGQKQRVAIARSMCMEPRILLLDEPTSSLDPELVHEVLEVMISLASEDITMICVTHEMGFAQRVANQVVFMDKGKIVEMGKPKQVFNAPKSKRCQEFLSKIMHPIGEL